LEGQGFESDEMKTLARREVTCELDWQGI